MRLHSRRGLIGYSRKEVERYASALESACEERRERISQQIHQLQRELPVIESRGEPHVFAVTRMGGQPFGVSPELEETDTTLTEQEAFRTVLFGLNKRNVKSRLRRYRELHQAELRRMLEQLAVLRAEQAWRLSLRTEEQASPATGTDAGQQIVREATTAEQETAAAAAAPLAIAGTPAPVAGTPEARADASPEAVDLSQEAIAVEPLETVDRSLEALPRDIMETAEAPLKALADAPPEAVDLPGPTDQAASPWPPPAAPLRQGAPGKLLAFRQRDGAARLAEPAPAPASMQPAAELPPAKPKAVGSGFWEDADDYLQLPRAEAALGSILEASVPAPDSSSPTYYESPLERPPVARRSETGGHPTYEPPQAAREREKPEPTAAAEPITPPADAVSSAITQEIRDLRSKYIVGKIAGEDLYDDRGQLLIAKGRTITAQTLQQAETNGKLAELIVNMIVPGLGDA